MIHSIKDHLQTGSIKKRENGSIFFRPNTNGIPRSFCKKASINLNNFSEFHKLVNNGGSCCATCMKSYNELLNEYKKLKRA